MVRSICRRRFCRVTEFIGKLDVSQKNRSAVQDTGGILDGNAMVGGRGGENGCMIAFNKIFKHVLGLLPEGITS